MSEIRAGKISKTRLEILILGLFFIGMLVGIGFGVLYTGKVVLNNQDLSQQGQNAAVPSPAPLATYQVIGEVESVAGNTITISENANVRNVMTNSSTVFMPPVASPGAAAATIADVHTGDKITARSSEPIGNKTQFYANYIAITPPPFKSL